jgi:hypothetical protein
VEARTGNDEAAGIYTVSSSDAEYADVRSIARSIDLAQERLWYCQVKEVIENFKDEFRRRIVRNPQLSIRENLLDENFLSLSFRGNYFADNLDKSFIEKVFSHSGMFTSTKRNFITELMGSLGKACMTYSCITLAQSRELGVSLKWPVVTVRVGSKQFKVFKRYVEEEQRIETEVVQDAISPIEGTEFEVVMVKPEDAQKFHLELKRIVRLYSIFNPEICFVLDLAGEKYTYGGTGEPKWRRWLTSAHWYDLKQFKQLIFSLRDEEETHHLMKLFREGYCTSFPNMKIIDLKRNEEQIQRLYEDLRKAQPKMPPSNYFQGRKEAVRGALEKGFGPLKSYKYEVLTGEYCFGEASIPFAVECFAFSSPNLKGNFYVDAVNCAPCLTSPFYEVLDWNQAFSIKIDGKEGETILLPSASFVLRQICGVDVSLWNKSKKKKVYVFLNLISPGIVWQSYGKSRIDVSNFKAAIAHALCKVGSAISGVGVNKGKDYKQIAREILERRLEEINKYGWRHVCSKNLWTRSSFFYTFRTHANKEYGIKPEELDRNYITSLIETVSAQMGFKREQLCIYAEPRARIYFRGKDFPITYHNLEQLARLGVILVVIEKEGVAAKLRKWADGLGIALIDSKGFLNEYPKELIELSKKYGAKIAALTDFDSAGVYMVLQLKARGLDIPRIGLWRDDVLKLGLKEEWVREAAEKKEGGKPTHYDALKKFLEKDISQNDYDFLKQWRIELDSVITTPEETENMWKLIIEKLKQLFPAVDYTRSIKMPSDMLLTMVTEPLTKPLKDLEDQILNNERQKHMSEFKNWNLREKGFIKVAEKEEELRQKFLETLNANEKVRKLLNIINELKNQL